MSNEKVWFVTGASKGLGLVLVKKLLQEGKRVAATSRSAESLAEAVGEISGNLLSLEMDLLNEESVSAAIRNTVDKFGRIDVVVNNAGYGQMGTLEELSDEEARSNFDVNVFGVLNVIRQVMPLLRGQRSGHIFNISSIGGFTGAFPGWGIYCATKFAVAGFSESLSAEAKAFGVNVSVVYPGYFRTNFLSEGSISTPRNPIAEYEDARQSQNMHQSELDGNQAGDPEKAASVMVRVSEHENPPLHLFLGRDAYGRANDEIEAIQKDMAAWEAFGTSTDFETKAAGE